MGIIEVIENSLRLYYCSCKNKLYLCFHICNYQYAAWLSAKAPKAIQPHLSFSFIFYKFNRYNAKKVNLPNMLSFVTVPKKVDIFASELLIHTMLNLTINQNCKTSGTIDSKLSNVNQTTKI